MRNTVVLDGEWSAAVPQNVADNVAITEQPVESLDIIIDGDASLDVPEAAECDLLVPQDGEVGTITVVHSGELPYYTGPFEVTPSQATQTLYTAETSLDGNIVINPIPSNYGLITWNGSVLTVS